MTKYLREISQRNRNGEQIGITSVCSANKFVVKATLKFAHERNNYVLIEATSNQVDQYGGYTGMTPKDFAEYVYSLANEVGMPREKIILGGDHLGPNVWQKESAESSMEKAKVQIAEYVKAGFTKIHLDTSMSLGGEKTKPSGLLSAEIVAERAAELCRVAEKTSASNDVKPVYVIGTDVPIPGGALENEDDIRITPPEELKETIEVTKKTFFEHGLEDAWERVIAVVVQPGVEFSDSKVFEYNKIKASALVDELKNYESLVFEAHSTDYQTAEKLSEMVSDNFAILKVGPWLTFALREALFALELIEKEIFSDEQRSDLRNVLEKTMIENPKYWEKHYKGSEKSIKLARAFSYSDRIRYYWNNKEVTATVNRLIDNLNSTEIPLTLVSQYLPNQYRAIREGSIDFSAENIISNKIEEVLKIYGYATGEEH